jgi:hypothetical protein
MKATTLTKIDELTGGRICAFDIACPWCGPRAGIAAWKGWRSAIHLAGSAIHLAEKVA